MHDQPFTIRVNPYTHFRGKPMTRFLALTLLTLIGLIILTVALNAPRVAEANAHTAAATALAAQANVTGMAVFGITCLAATLGLVILAGIGLLFWLMLNGQLPTRGRVQPLPHLRPRSGPHRMRLASSTPTHTTHVIPVTPQPRITVYGYPDEIEVVSFNLPPGWGEGEWPDAFWTEEGR